jgi:ABC-type branched-subunit amino acid transport system ATPase component
MAFMEVHDVYKHFGGIPALDGVSLSVEGGKIHGVIGPNGAGKTTMFNVINGVYGPDRGTVSFRDRDITGFKPNHIASMGIGRTFQVARVFNEMTLMENMMVPIIPRGVSKKERRGPWSFWRWLSSPISGISWPLKSRVGRKSFWNSYGP